MAITITLETVSFFILLLPGFLPFFFLVQSYLTPPLCRDRASVIICFFVFLLGPLSACIAAIRIGILVSNRQDPFLKAIQAILQGFVEFSYRLPTLLLLNPPSFLTRATTTTISEKQLNIHNIMFATLIPISFVLTVIHVSIIPEKLPRIVPTSFAILTALFPIPLQYRFANSTKTPRIRRVWLLFILIQLFSATAVVMSIPIGIVFSILSAVFTVLWFGSTITLFYGLYSSPISQFSSCHVCLSPLPRPPTIGRVSSPRVVYEDVSHHRNQRQSSRGLISEDFTALRDPFASPTRVGPSPRSPEPYSPVTPPATPQVLRTSIVVPSPTSPQRTHSPPPRRKKARVKTPSHHIPSSCRFTNNSVGKKISSQSLQPLAGGDAKEVQEENKPNEESFFLNDEALLSQILLHTLTMEATSPTSVPRGIHHSNSLSSCQEEPSLPDAKRLSSTAASRIHKNNSSMQTISTNDTASIRMSRKRHSRSRNKAQYSTECLGMRRNTSSSAFRSSGTDSGSVVTDTFKAKQHETTAIPSEERSSCWWDEP